MRRSAFLLLLCICFTTFCSWTALGQEKGNYKFGEVSKDELMMKVYEPDTSAAAVVLYSGGEYAMDAKLSSVFTLRKSYTKRIKVIKPEGAKYATVKIPYKRMSQYTERVAGLEAYVYYLDGDEIKSLKMPKDSIKETKSNFINRETEFTVPGVSPGCIIEYKYSVVGTMPEFYNESEYIKASYMDYFVKNRWIIDNSELRRNDAIDLPTDYQEESMMEKSAFSFDNFSIFSIGLSGVTSMDGMVSGDDIMFPKWYFGEEIPVVKSVIEFTYFDEFIFEDVLTGLVEPEIIVNDGRIYKVAKSLQHSKKPVTLSTKTSKKPVDQTWFTDPLQDKFQKNRVYIAENLPAIRETEDENFVINPPKYRMSVEFDYKGTHSSAGDKTYSSNWYEVDNILYKDAELGRRILFAPNMYKDTVESIMKSNLSDFNKAEAICRVIKNDIECTSYGKGEKIRPPKQAFETKTGNDMEINALVIAAFKKTGMKTNLILLKGRDKGYLGPDEISMSIMNTSVVEITLGNGEKVYFDPSVKDISLNILNHLHLTEKGRIYQKGETWVNLANIVENKEHHTAILNLDKDGMVEGKVYTIATNHCCYDYAEQMQDAVIEEEYFNRLKEKINGEFIEGYTYKADTVNNIFKRDFEFRRSSAIFVDDKMLVNPFVEIYYSGIDFTQPQRKFPVEFKYPKTIEYSANITIPEGYEIDALPESISYSMGKTGTRATLRSSAHGNTVMIGLTIMLKDTYIPLEDYPQFKEYWKHMCGLFNETIVLKKKGSNAFTDTLEY